MSPFWHWHTRIFGFACLGAMGLMIWRDSSWYGVIPFVVGAALSLHMHRFVRCPDCSRRLRGRLAREPATRDSWRILYDCSECRITWDSRYVQDPS
jgi:hypothetical protein